MAFFSVLFPLGIASRLYPSGEACLRRVIDPRRLISGVTRPAHGRGLILHICITTFYELQHKGKEATVMPLSYLHKL